MRVKNFAITLLFPNSNNEEIFKCIMRLFNQERNNKSFLFHTYKDSTWLNELYLLCIDDILLANWSSFDIYIVILWIPPQILCKC